MRRGDEEVSMTKKLVFYLVLLIFGITGVAGATLICHRPDCPDDSEFTIWKDHIRFEPNSLSHGQFVPFEFDINPDGWDDDPILAAWTLFHFEGGERDWYLGKYYSNPVGDWTQYELIYSHSNGHAWEPERLRSGALSDLQDDGILSGFIKNITPAGWDCSDGVFSVKEAWLIAKGCDTNPVPEPATLLLLGSGLIAFAGIGRKKIFKKKKK